MNYEEALEYLNGLKSFAQKPGLERISAMLKLLGNPHLKYKTVHVTGTNGKGSVCAMLSSILSRSNINTGLYISPHLTSYTERIQLNDHPISEAEFADSIAAVREAAERLEVEKVGSPTQFEVLTAAAFYCFAVNGVEYAVVEVGIGGLWDSTNVIQPDVCIITNIAFEHARLCGGTLEGIARHKAGIMKDGVPVVTDAKGMTLDVLRSEAVAKSADIFVEDKDFVVHFLACGEAGQRIKFTSEILGINDEFSLSLLGEHQLRNSALSIMTAYLLANDDERIGFGTISEALSSVRWPGRFEIFSREGDGAKIIVDGAHNPAGVAMLRQNLDAYFPGEKRIFVLGLLRDRDVELMLKTLVRPGDVLIATFPDSERAADPLVWTSLPELKDCHVEVCGNRSAALQRAMELLTPGQIVCVAGSLYLIGELREVLLQILAKKF